MIKANLLLLLLVIYLCNSCITPGKLRYMRGKRSDELLYTTASKEIIKIKPGDQLYIRVSSLDDVSYNFFSTQADYTQMNYGNEISISLVSYTVSDSGTIYFPILKNIYLKDLTITEATEKMQRLLSEYFNQPTVIIKLVNTKITVIGEVSAPGHYYFSKTRLNIFEAIGTAGDVTLNGNKKRVFLIREQDNKIIKRRIDLTRDNILSSPQFYVQSGDIIYVNSRGTALWSITSSTYSLILSSITTFLLVLNYINQ